MAPIEALDDAARERLRQKYALLNDGSFSCLAASSTITNSSVEPVQSYHAQLTPIIDFHDFRAVQNMTPDSAPTKREYDDGDDSDCSDSTNGKRMKGGSNDDPIETRRERFGVQRLLVSFGHPHQII
jgi:hypothetical protein